MALAAGLLVQPLLYRKMAVVSRTTLKAYFQTGSKPTQAQFENLIDSLLHVLDENEKTVAGVIDIDDGNDDAIDISVLNCSSNTDYVVIISAYEQGDESAKVTTNISTGRDVSIVTIYNNSGVDATFEYIIQKK